MRKKWVSIGSNEYPDYSFPLPIAMALWREVVGYEPVAVLTENSGFWEADTLRALVYHEAARQGRVRFAGHHPKYKSGSVAQLARHFWCADPEVNWDDLTMPSDTDIWPLTRDFYHTHHPRSQAVGLYYANGTGEENHFATCHMSMCVLTAWKVYGMRQGDTIETMTRRVFEENHHDDMSDMDVWMFDQVWASKRIVESEYYPGSAHKINREGLPPKDRIDRSNWPQVPVTEGMTDAHLPRPPYSDKYWPSLSMIIRQVLGPEDAAYWDQYREDFVSAKA